MIEPLWSDVTRAAGVDGTTFSLWMQDTDEVNAHAAAGRIVAVTRGSLRDQPPHHLAAVLAHELGHHLGGHARASLLSAWYAIPGRLVLHVVRVIVRVALAVAKVFSLFGYLLALFCLGVMLIAASCTSRRCCSSTPSRRSRRGPGGPVSSAPTGGPPNSGTAGR